MTPARNTIEASDRPVALITGASSGIGRATALHFARARWNVAINYSSSAVAADEVARDCKRAGVETLVCQADVADDVSCRRLAAETMARWGRIDVLVNNAGVTTFAPADDLEALTAFDFQKIFSVNVVGAYQMIRAVAPAMKDAGRGSVVNTSSFAALTGFGSSSAYAASKGALNTLTLSLARALSPEIRVNAVCPSFVDTDWHKDGMDSAAIEKNLKAFAKVVPLAEVTTPEHVAEAIFWLATGARHVTGELLRVDAGAHLAHPMA